MANEEVPPLKIRRKTLAVLRVGFFSSPLLLLANRISTAGGAIREFCTRTPLLPVATIFSEG